MLIDVLPRALLGAFLAGVAAVHAYRGRKLTLRGGYAAFAVGTAAVAGGIGWGLSLVVFFYSAVQLSDWQSDRKRTRSYGVLPDRAERDAWQVLANGGLFAAAALMWRITGSREVGLFGFGALATATADTWATEIGMALDASPRHVITWRHVAPGTSGGVSAIGLGAAVAGSFLMALFAAAGYSMSLDLPLLDAVLVGGLAGTLADSLLGATLQSQRWCDACQQWTERAVHTCGNRSRHSKGVRWMSNDVVNLLATAAGGLTAASVWRP